MAATLSLARQTVARQEARLAKGYSLEDLAIATGLTIDEIDAAEQGVAVHEQHLEHIKRALR